MLIEKTGKLARTVNGLRPINILKHQKVDEDCYPVFDADDNPIWDGYEVAAVDAVGAPQIRIFGKFETLKEAQHFAKTLPNTVD